LSSCQRCNTNIKRWPNLLNMQKLTFILALIFILCSCGQTNRTKPHIKTGPTISKTIKTDRIEKATSIKTLIAGYISRSKNPLVALSREQEEWIFDRTMKTDTANYFVYQIGHDVTDEANTNPRFVTDQWIYIDSLKSKLYEYDLANDSLIEWMN